MKNSTLIGPVIFISLPLQVIYELTLTQHFQRVLSCDSVVIFDSKLFQLDGPILAVYRKHAICNFVGSDIKG